jgi:ribosomal protein L11 methyltransferase
VCLPAFLMFALRICVHKDFVQQLEDYADGRCCDNFSAFENNDLGFSEQNDDDGFPIANYFDVEILLDSMFDAQKLQEYLALKFQNGICNSSICYLSEKDWVDVYTKELQPIVCGKFYVFNDSVHSYPEESDLIPIKINSALAFGSGHHQTTQACIINISKLYETTVLNTTMVTTSILDMGCGTGILGICATKILNNYKLLGIDIDPVAVEIAQENYIANDIINGETLNTSTVPLQMFNLILCNILKQPLIDMSKIFYESLLSGGVTVVSGFILSQESEIIECYESIGFITQNIVHLDEWSSILLYKPQ